MSIEVDPTVGQWYATSDGEEVFKVISVDMVSLVIGIQGLDGEVGEIEVADWEVLDIVEIEQPAEWDEGAMAAESDSRLAGDDDEYASQDDEDDSDDLDDDDEIDGDDGDEDEDDDFNDLDDDDEGDWDDDEEEDEADLDDDDDDEDDDDDTGAGGRTATGDEWRLLLRRQVDEEIVRQSRIEQRRAALIERRLHARAAAKEMLDVCFSQIRREAGVVVAQETGPPAVYSVRVEGATEWLERIQYFEGDAEGTWHVVCSSGGVIKKLPELEQYLKSNLTKRLARALATVRAEQQRQASLAAEARVRAQELEMARQRQAAEARERNRILDYEARMRARSQGRPDEKK